MASFRHFSLLSKLKESEITTRKNFLMTIVVVFVLMEAY